MTPRQKARRNKQVTQKVFQVAAFVALATPVALGGGFILACICVKASINFGWM